MNSAVTTFLTVRLGSQPLCGVLALTRVVPRGMASHSAEDARFNYEDVDQGGELRAGAVSYEMADSVAAIAAGIGAEFMCRVYNAAAEKLETGYEVIESDASQVTWTPHDAT